MATSEQSGGAGMFSDLVGLKEHGKGGDDTEKVSSVDVSSVVREVVKESLVPLIQRVMLKIDALDGKVKQMQLAMDEMEEDGRERDGWLKKGLEEMKEELAGVREGVGERTKDEGDESESETETETETGAGGLDIEELQALLNQKVEMEKKKKKKNKGVVYHQQGDEVQHHHVASGSHSSSGGLPLGPPPPADRGPPAPPPPAPVSSSYRAPPVNAGHPYGQMGHVPPPPPPPPGTHDGMHSQTTPYTSTSSGGAYAPQSSVSNGGGTYTAQPRVSSGPYAPYAGYQPSGAPLPPPAAAPPAAAAAPQPHTSGSAGSVPIEKVIDDIAIMGFSREEVRNVLRELTAQGKSVDMNIVLDRLGAR